MLSRKCCIREMTLMPDDDERLAGSSSSEFGDRSDLSPAFTFASRKVSRPAFRRSGSMQPR